MGDGTNSKILRAVTDGPFLRANMSKCTSDNKNKIHTGTHGDPDSSFPLWAQPTPLWNFSSRNRVTPVSIQDGV